jgi:hypothetical protein
VSAASRLTRNLQPRSSFLANQRQFPTKFLPHEVLPHHTVASIETANKLAGLVLIRSLGCGPSGPLFSRAIFYLTTALCRIDMFICKDELRKSQIVSYTRRFGLFLRIISNSLSRDLHRFGASAAAAYVSATEQPNRASAWRQFNRSNLRGARKSCGSPG